MKLFSEKIWQTVEVSKVVECHGSNFEVLLKLVSGCVEGPYCGEVEVSGCAEDERCVKA